MCIFHDYSIWKLFHIDKTYGWKLYYRNCCNCGKVEIRVKVVKYNSLIGDVTDEDGPNYNDFHYV